MHKTPAKSERLFLYSSFNSNEHVAHSGTELPAAVPQHTVHPVAQLGYAMIFRIPIEAHNQTNHLVWADTMLIHILIVTDAGIGIPYRHNPVQHILTVIPLVQRQIILFQFFRQRRKHYAVNILTEHRQHAGTLRLELHRFSLAQLFPNQGHQRLQPKGFFTQEIRVH